MNTSCLLPAQKTNKQEVSLCSTQGWIIRFASIWFIAEADNYEPILVIISFWLIVFSPLLFFCWGSRWRLVCCASLRLTSRVCLPPHMTCLSSLPLDYDRSSRGLRVYGCRCLLGGRSHFSARRIFPVGGGHPPRRLYPPGGSPW